VTSVFYIGFISYAGRLGPNFEEIRPLLELLAVHDDELPGDWL
jgi:hypothetical protein